MSLLAVEVVPPSPRPSSPLPLSPISPTNDSETIGLVIAGKYTIEKKVGSGAFGEVFLVRKNTSNDIYAAKREKKGTKFPQLANENRVMAAFVGKVGFAQVQWFGIDGEYLYLIMDLLGPSLEDLFVFCGDRFSLKSVLMIADQMLSRIEQFHSADMIHSDIKPENFLIGIPNKKTEGLVYIIDFGLAKRYRDHKTHEHIAWRENRSLVGTARYVSLNTHLGMEQSRRDDLEAIGYVLLYFLLGKLPWQGLKITNPKMDKNYKIKAKKMATAIEVLCKDVPNEFYLYFKNVRSLGFEDKPNYQFLRKCYRDLFTNCEFRNDGVYDWSKAYYDDKVARPIKKKSTKSVAHSNKNNVLSLTRRNQKVGVEFRDSDDDDDTDEDGMDANSQNKNLENVDAASKLLSSKAADSPSFKGRRSSVELKSDLHSVTVTQHEVGVGHASQSPHGLNLKIPAANNHSSAISRTDRRPSAITLPVPTDFNGMKKSPSFVSSSDNPRKNSVVSMSTNSIPYDKKSTLSASIAPTAASTIPKPLLKLGTPVSKSNSSRPFGQTSESLVVGKPPAGVNMGRRNSSFDIGLNSNVSSFKSHNASITPSIPAKSPGPSSGISAFEYSNSRINLSKPSLPVVTEKPSIDIKPSFPSNRRAQSLSSDKIPSKNVILDEAAPGTDATFDGKSPVKIVLNRSPSLNALQSLPSPEHLHFKNPIRSFGELSINSPNIRSKMSQECVEISESSKPINLESYIDDDISCEITNNSSSPTRTIVSALLIPLSTGMSPNLVEERPSVTVIEDYSLVAETQNHVDSLISSIGDIDLTAASKLSIFGEAALLGNPVITSLSPSNQLNSDVSFKFDF